MEPPSTSPAPLLQDAKKVLRDYFGYESFRPLQEEIISTAFAKRDCLVLMPTGGGKSLCYQIPAIVQPGVCVVLSPLIALMKDQVEALRSVGARAAFLNSSLDPEAQRHVEDAARSGELDALYVSPERLQSEGFQYLLAKLDVNLFAIDEAHCISAWGHDFRPEYTQLKFLKERYPDVPVMALTATADKATRDDILLQLGVPQARRFVASFDRPNLKLTVLPGRDRMGQILRFVSDRPHQSGIVYCLSRKSTEQVAAKLQEAGVNAAHYHAGLDPDERSRVQEDFVSDRVPVVCATVAFGMGIDKSNVRWVIHYNLPKNLESYYQEIGRAGRDGLKSDTLLFYSFADVARLREFVDESGQADLQLAKLDRMQQYAEAKTCRRRVLLSYFGESLTEDCGNCDVCQNPPVRFDGTTLAQKALSAIVRLKREKDAQVGIGLLVDVLRGSGKSEIRQNGYDQIKTYGAGSSHSYFDWQQYVVQFLNEGLIELDYANGHTLRLTESGGQFLQQKKTLELARFEKQQAAPKEQSRKVESETLDLVEADLELFERLRALRKSVAEEQNVPPYIVFNDRTLRELAYYKPKDLKLMGGISGIGQKKLERYGDTFLKEIKDFLN